MADVTFTVTFENGQFFATASQNLDWFYGKDFLRTFDFKIAYTLDEINASYPGATGLGSGPVVEMDEDLGHGLTAKTDGTITGPKNNTTTRSSFSLDLPFEVYWDAPSGPNNLPADVSVDIVKEIDPSLMGVWADSVADSTNKNAAWTYIELSESAGQYHFKWARYDVSGSSGFQGTPTFESNGDITLYIGPLVYTLKPGVDPKKGPYMKLIDTYDPGYIYLRRVELFVTVGITAKQDSTTNKWTFTKGSPVTHPIPGFSLGSTQQPTSDTVYVPNGKNLLLEYVLQNDDLQFSDPLIAPSAPTKSLPAKLSPQVGHSASDPYEHLFIFDFDNLTGSADTSYKFTLETTGGKVEPTIVEKGHSGG